MDQTEMLITEAVLGRHPTPEKENRKRYVLRCLFWFVGLFAAGIVSLSVYLYFNQDEIKRLVVNEINRNLQAPVSVRDIRVGMWRDFPMISVSFEGVSGNGTRNEDREELFHAESLTFSFNLRDILQQRYIVREIVVRGGEFNLKYYGGGAYNYLIWQVQKEKGSQPFSFHLRRILLRNTLVRFRDLPARHDFQVLVRNVAAKGDLYENGQDFQLKGGVDIHSMKAAGFVFLHHRKGSLDVRFTNDHNEKRFSIRYGKIGIEDMDFTTRGYVRYDNREHALAFDFKGKALRMENLLSFLPEASAKYVEDYGFKGNLDFNMRIEGDYTRTPLALNATFHYGQGKIRHKPSAMTVSDVELHGSFTNGGKTVENCRLVLDTLYAKFPTGTVEGRFSIDNFQIPHIRYQGAISADLAELQTFLKLFPDVALSGHLRSKLIFSHTFPSLKPQQWQTGDFGTAETRGFLQLKDFHVAFAGKEPLSCDSLYAEFTPKVLKTGYFVLKGGDMELKTRLFVENLLPYLLLSQQRLYATASIRSPRLDWESLLVLFPEGEKEKKIPVPSPKKRRNLLQDLYADVELDVKHLTFPQSGLDNLKTGFRYMPEHILLENTTFDALQGHFEGTAEMERRKEGWQVQLQGKIDQMDIGAGFKAFDNFGQRQLTYRNIGGTVSSDFKMGLFYSDTDGVVSDSIQMLASIDITGGHLQNMESLKRIARFTGEDDLQDIHFTDLHNMVEIHKGCIRIPQMQVFSSAADLSFSGTHTFANEVDYTVTVELSSLLSRRRAQRIKKEEEFGVVTGPQSRIRLPLHIKGVLPDVEVKYLFSQARKGAGDRLKENAQELKEALDEAYSQMRKKREARMDEQKTRKRQEQGEFIIDTEESEPLKKPQKPTVKDSTVQKKKKYKTEEDFRIEFEDD